jgi:hypothetical protein
LQVTIYALEKLAGFWEDVNTSATLTKKIRIFTLLFPVVDVVF